MRLWLDHVVRLPQDTMQAHRGGVVISKSLAAVLGAVVFAGAPPASAQGLNFTIDNCGCDSACYSGNAGDVHCSGSSITFRSNGLPDLGDTLMTGIKATNQQFPRAHDFEFTITRTPQPAARPTYPEPGAIGVAVNGVPIFDPASQGPVDPITGKRPNTYEGGELDVCGGHAGRGDDYHYHMAPKCLIEKLGEKKIEQDKQPVGFAMDGYPILALGWFDKANDIEARLDKCRGIKDASGTYFYNVKHTPDYDVLNCLAGQFDPRRFARDNWTARKDAYGADVVGIPLAFTVDSFEVRTGNGAACEVMSGTLTDGQVLNTDQSVSRVANRKGALFYCNPGCYGQFLEADAQPGVHGRVIYFESPRDKCPAALRLSALKTFAAYEGPAQSRKGPPGTSPNGK